jgi:hypothetical protein
MDKKLERTSEPIDLLYLLDDDEEIKSILNDMALDDYTNKKSSIKDTKFRNNIIVNCICCTNCSLNNYPKHLLTKSHTEWISPYLDKRYRYKVRPTD